MLEEALSGGEQPTTQLFHAPVRFQGAGSADATPAIATPAAPLDRAGARTPESSLRRHRAKPIRGSACSLALFQTAALQTCEPACPAGRAQNQIPFVDVAQLFAWRSSFDRFAGCQIYAFFPITVFRYDFVVVFFLPRRPLFSRFASHPIFAHHHRVPTVRDKLHSLHLSTVPRHLTYPLRAGQHLHNRTTGAARGNYFVHKDKHFPTALQYSNCQSPARLEGASRIPGYGFLTN